MNFHSIRQQHCHSITRALWRVITAAALFAIAPLALAQQLLLPATVSFGNVPLTVPVTQTATFTNNSTFQPVTITALSTSDARFAAVGSGASPCNVGAVVSFNASCTYALTFTPSSPGAFNNTTTVAYNVVATAALPLTQTSSGTGFTPPSTASPPTILFGNVPLTVISNQPFTFTNNSNTTLFPASYTLVSFATSGLGFSAVGSGGTPCAVGLVLPPAASCGATASFQINGSGASNGTTTIGFQTGQGANPVFNTSVALNGVGFAPPYTNTPAALNFGNVVVNVAAPLSYTFTNNSDTTLFPSSYTLTSFSTTGLGYTAVGSGGTPCAVSLVLPPGASCGVTATFQIAVTGSSGGSTTIGFLAGLGSNPPYSSVVALSGTGVAPPAPVIASSTTASAITGSAFTYSILATNSPTSFGASGLPAGITVNTGNGIISGTPSVSGTFVVTITATNAGGTGSQGLSLTITAATIAPSITSAAPVGGTVGTAYTHTFTAGGTTPVNWSIATGALPPGVTLNAASGILSGTPTAAGSFGFTIQAANGTPPNATQSVTIVIAAAAPPTVGLSLSSPTVTVGSGAVGLVLNFANPSAAPLAGGTFTLTFPAGVVTATSPGIVNSCGGAFSSAPGSTAIAASGLAIGANGSCALGVSVSSAVTGSYIFTFPAGAFTASSSSNTVASNVTLTVIALATPTINFAFVPASITVAGSTVGTLTISNSNAAPLTANPFVFNYLPGSGLVNASAPTATSTCSGAAVTATPGAGSFNQGTSFIIPASGSCSFSSTVTTSTAGTNTGTIPAGLIVTSAGNSAASNSVTFVVTAAASPAVTLAPGVLTFGTRTVGTTSPVSTATLGNSGTALLTILSITASGDYAFTTSCPLAPSTLAVGIACPINVTFSPLAVGARAGNIAIVSNAPGSPHAIALSGTGSGGAVANISLAPAALAFAAQTVNTNSALQRVVVSNSGFANLLISNIGISAPFSRVPLGAVVPPDCGGSVAPGNSCQIGVIFSPASGGPLTGQISIIDNATGSPHTVGLSGTGVAVPVAVISASALLAFGDQVINSAGSVQNLTISNSGSATLNISAITLTGTHAANFNLTGQSGCVSIAPAGSCILPITFTTTTIGAKIAQVNITSDAQNAALVNTVNLTGNGILAPRPVVNITATAIGYGNVIFGGATPNQIVTLTNSGGQAMNIPSIVVTGDFVQMNNCGTSLASLASCTISIIFTPLGQGARFGELILTSSATSSPDRIQLSGTGCRWFSQAQSRFFLTSCG